MYERYTFGCVYLYDFVILRCIRKIEKSDVRPCVCPPVRVEKLGSYWTDLIKFDIWDFVLKFVENIHVSLKYNKNNWYFTLTRFHTYDNA